MGLKMKLLAIPLSVAVGCMGFMPQTAQAHAYDKAMSQRETSLASARAEVNPLLASGGMSALSLAVRATMSSLPQPDIPPGGGRATFASSALTLVTQSQAPGDGNQDGIGVDLDALLAATTDLTDTDEDGLPDSVEAVLGTDPENTDSDFDELDDYYEADNGLDPLKPDSNGDGLADYLEVSDIPWDLDGDGEPNAWDSDNDDDGVPDSLDISPFTKSTTDNNFHFNIKTNGNPTYLNFQIRPTNPDHLRLPLRIWDWPDDDKGNIQDLDGSTDDVQIMPMLELSADQLPEQSEVEDYGIIITEDKAYIPLSLVQDYGTTVAFSGQMFYPASGPLNLSADANLVWMVNGKIDGYLPCDSTQTSPGIGHANDGGGAVIADINGNGTPDLLLMGIDDPSGNNEFWYMIGWDLNTSGTPSSWSSTIHVPGIGSSTAGGGADIADINRNGTPDLLLMGIDDPSGSNEFRYKIGWDISPNGTPSGGWSNTMTSPDIGSANDGGGAALADINGNGTLDLLLMGIDAPSGSWVGMPPMGIGNNEFWYMIGWDLNTSGTPSSWSSTTHVPGIGSSTAGGGIDIADIDDNGTLDLLLMGIDDPKGANQFRCKVGWNMDANGNPSDWGFVSKSSQIGYSNDGGGTAITDIDGDGELDLLLMGIDDPKGANKFWYRIVWGIDSELGTQNTTLAKYQDDFLLTGFSVEENYGSDAGLFYSDDKDETTNAYVALRYEFMNSQTPLSETPIKLTENNVSVTHQIDSFSHQYEALKAVTTEMTQIALDSLPDGQILPIVFAFEDVSTDKAMDSFASGSCITGNSYDVDLTGESQVTIKSMKMVWYDTTDDVPLEPHEIINEVQTWGWDDEETENAMKLLLVWNFGEGKITNIGGDETDFDPPEQEETLTWLKTGAATLKKLVMLPAYINGAGFLLINWNAAGWTGNSFKSIAKAAGSYYNVIRGMKVAPGGMKHLESVIGHQLDMKTWGGKFSTSAKWAKGLRITGIVIGVGIAFYAFYQIASQSGWSSFGLAVGAMYGSLTLLYLIALEILFCTGTVGMVIAGLVIASDLIVAMFYGKGWSEMAIEWLVDEFTETHILTMADLKTLEHSVDIYDTDDNGLDAGDRIRIKSRIKEIIRTTGDGELEDLQASWISTSYGACSSGDMYSPEFTSDKFSNVTGWTYSGSTEKERERELGANIYPQQGKVNLRVGMKFTAVWNLRYDECVAGWCTSEDYEDRGGDDSPFFFDVLPGNINDFVNWGDIAPLDVDGDGLRNERHCVNMVEDECGEMVWVDGYCVGSSCTQPYEYCAWYKDPYCVEWGYDEVDDNGANLTTCALKWDTDEDGLSDKFELDYGTDPTNPDSDGDGLDDGFEFHLETDPLDTDTDGDGISDFEEYDGWDINFTYCNQSFTKHVWTDPLVFNSQAPVAYDDTAITSEDTVVTIDVLGNDTDDDSLTVVSLTQPDNGTVINNETDVTYTPNPNFNGTDSFTYKASDGADDSNVAVVTVTVDPVNDSPMAEASGPYTVAEGDPVVLTGTGTDIDDDSLTYHWDLDGDGIFETVGQSPAFSAAGLDGPSNVTITLRVSDDEEAFDTATATVDITNVAPVLSDISVTSPISENGVATLTGNITDPGAQDTFTLAVDWGDDSPVETFPYAAGTATFSETHRYLDDNPTGTESDEYTISLTLTDDDTGESNASTTVITNNVAPVLSDISVTSPISENGVATLTGDITDPGTQDTFTLAVDWGDDSPVETFPYAAGTAAFSETHQYLDDNPTGTESDEYTISLTLTDDDTGENNASTTVITNNMAPVLSDISVTSPISENGVATLTGDITDPGTQDTFTLAVDWGDDSPIETFTYAAGTATFSETHRYLDDNPTGTESDEYTISLTLTDDDTGENNASTTVEVNNVAPTVDAGLEATIDEGDTFLSSGSFTDPGPDTWTATVDYGDGSGVQPLSLDTDMTFSLNHTYADNNVYTVTITVTDDDTGVGIGTMTVTVNNVAPTVDAGPDVENFSGQIHQLSASFTDPGIIDTHTAIIDWGDGLEPEDGEVNESDGSGTVTGSHQYFVPGTYIITVTVTDKDEGEGLDSIVKTVLRLPVRIDIKPGSDPNSINLNSKGKIPVSIFGGEYEGIILDASTIDWSSVVFTEAPALDTGKSPAENLDGDGYLDQIYHFNTQETNLTEDSTEACLTGMTTGNIYFEGYDSVRIVPLKGKK